MNGHALIDQDPTDRLSGHFPQGRTALRQAVQKFGQDFVGRNQADFSEGLAGAHCLCAVLIAWMKYRAPVERVRKDQLHFFFVVG
jgi:hypothetical protein